MKPRSPSLKSQLAQRRWSRVETVSARSRGLRRPSGDAARRRPPVDWNLRLRRAALLATILLAGWSARAAWRWVQSPGPADIRAGQQLFTHKWVPHDPHSAAGDGLGPMFNARSCAECHFQGGVGGGGGMAQNVAAFEVLPTLGHPQPTGGVIHAFATQPDWSDSPDVVRRLFPIVPRGVTLTAVCRTPLLKDYDPLVRHSINTPTLFGAGAIDRLSPTAIRLHHAQRNLAIIPQDMALDFQHAAPGRLRILPGGRVGKFGWKAQFATLEEFVANACAVEVGLTTPTRKQHLPQRHTEDPDARPDLDRRQFAQLVAFVAELPPPQPPLSLDSSIVVDRGRELFSAIGCADCHTPDLGGVRGVYSDFCLHDLTDPQTDGYTATPQVPIPDDYPRPSEWKTPPLWGAAQTAPYLHDGTAPTFERAIEAHAGQARHVREKFRNLPAQDCGAVLRFLDSLRHEVPQ